MPASTGFLIVGRSFGQTPCRLLQSHGRQAMGGRRHPSRAQDARGAPQPLPGEVRHVIREGGFPRRNVGAPGGRAWGDAPLEPGPGRARLSPSRPEGSGPAAAPGPRSRRVGGKPGHAILPRDVYRQTARRLPKRSPDDKESRRCRDSLRRRRRCPRKLARADAKSVRVALRAPVRAGRGRRPDRLPLRLSGMRRGRHRPGERGRPGLTSLPLTTRASGPAGAAALARAGGGLSHPRPNHSNTSTCELFTPCAPMAVSKSQEKQRRRRLWAALAVLTVATLGLSVWLAGPSPPRKIVLATGQEGGGYDRFGQQYQARLAKMGLEVELLNTNGSVDNLQRLLDGEADVAFVQAGTYRLVDDSGQRLRGLVAVYLEHLWVYSRGPRSVRTLSDLKGLPPPAAAAATAGLLGSPGGAGPLVTSSTLAASRAPTISIGPERSGTEVVGRLLLRAHGVTAENARIVNLDNEEAGRGLKDGSVDVALLISSYRDPAILDLLARKDVQLMDFQRQDLAHSRQFPYLNSVKLAEGLLNLKDNLPREEKT